MTKHRKDFIASANGGQVRKRFAALYNLNLSEKLISYWRQSLKNAHFPSQPNIFKYPGRGSWSQVRLGPKEVVDSGLITTNPAAARNTLQLWIAQQTLIKHTISHHSSHISSAEKLFSMNYRGKAQKQHPSVSSRLLYSHQKWRMYLEVVM